MGDDQICVEYYIMSTTQPRDPNHPIYKMIAEMLVKGDVKDIASELEVSKTVVSLVKNGKTRSARVWQAVVDKALKRKKDQDQFARMLSKQES